MKDDVSSMSESISGSDNADGADEAITGIANFSIKELNESPANNDVIITKSCMKWNKLGDDEESSIRNKISFYSSYGPKNNAKRN